MIAITLMLLAGAAAYQFFAAYQEHQEQLDRLAYERSRRN